MGSTELGVVMGWSQDRHHRNGCGNGMVTVQTAPNWVCQWEVHRAGSTETGVAMGWPQDGEERTEEEAKSEEAAAANVPSKAARRHRSTSTLATQHTRVDGAVVNPSQRAVEKGDCLFPLFKSSK
jgi:hypothetical protein